MARRTNRRRSKSPAPAKRPLRGATPRKSRADKIREAARALLPTLRELEREGTQVHGPTTGGFHGNTYYELDDTLYTVNEEEVVADEPNCGPQTPVNGPVKVHQESWLQLVWVLAALIAVWWWLRSSSTDHASAIGVSSPTPDPLHAGGVVEHAGV